MAVQIEQNDTTPHVYSQAAHNGQVASTVLFLITGIALAALYALNPHDFLLPANYPAFAVIGSVATGSLACFVISTVIRCRTGHRVAELSNKEPDNSFSAKTKLERAYVQDSNDSVKIRSSDSTKQEPDNDSQIPAQPNRLHVRPQTTKLTVTDSKSVAPPIPIISDPLAEELMKIKEESWQEIEKLILAFNGAYYRAEKKQPQHEKEIRDGLAILKGIATTKAIEKFQDKPKLVLEGVNSLLPDLIYEPACLRTDANQWVVSPPSFLVEPKIDGESVDPTHLVKQSVFSIIQEVFHLISQRKDLAHDQDYQSLWTKWKESSKDYFAKRESINKKTNNDKNKRTTTQKKELANLATDYCEKRDALFSYLIETTTISSEQADAWAPLILDATVKCTAIQKRGDIIKNLSGFGPDGFKGMDKDGLRDGDFRTKVYGATTAPGLTYSVIESELVKATKEAKEGKPIPPQTQQYINETMRAVKILLPALANPVFYATCPSNQLAITATPSFMSPAPSFHPLYTKLQEICTDSQMAPPILDPARDDWRAYLSAYNAYIRRFTTRINALTF